MENKKIKQIVLSGLFLSVGLVLPFLTGQLRELGNMLLPMHLPTFLCGLIIGPFYGFFVGLIMPILRSILFGMPTMYPRAIAMAVELSAYGFASGFLYKNLFKTKSVFTLYISLIISMLFGRIVWGITEIILLGIDGNVFTFSAFWVGAFANSFIGIVIQLILIPLIITALQKARLI